MVRAAGPPAMPDGPRAGPASGPASGPDGFAARPQPGSLVITTVPEAANMPPTP